jgi:hypothetical protein
MARFRSGTANWMTSCMILIARKSVIRPKPFRRNFANCAASTMSLSTSGTCGTKFGNEHQTNSRLVPGRADEDQTEGLAHTSPGQRPGFIAINSHFRLKACFILSPRCPQWRADDHELPFQGSVGIRGR